VVKGPAADATEAPQPLGLLCNPMMKMIFFFVFPCNGAQMELNGQRKTEVLGGKTCPSATLVTSNLTWTAPGSKIYYFSVQYSSQKCIIYLILKGIANCCTEFHIIGKVDFYM
jgi:hypothetical protein